METAKDSLIDLERHRRRLEENINELQNALRHWRTWDAEYEALKEEVDAAGDDDSADPAELARIRAEFEGELVNRKEVDDIFGRAPQRSKDQIINVLDRRIDYVTKSIQSLQKQLETAENKYAAASVISQPDAEDEEGQPMTEIVEELDDDDNVISYKLNQPGQSMPHIREALQKAGVKDLPPEEEHASSSRVTEPPPAQEDAPSAKSRPQPPGNSSSRPSSAKSTPAPKMEAKKVVSFSDDTNPAGEPEAQKSWAAERVEDIMRKAKDQENLSKQKPVIPDDEDSDDAALRQEMLKYSMGELGAVVAELQLEEGSDDDDEDDWDYSDEGFDEEEDDDEEDKWGRSTGGIVTDKYRRRMLELEEKLGIKSRFTAAREAEAAATKADPDKDYESGSDDERIGRIVVNRDAAPPSSASQAPPQKPATKSKQANGGGAEKKGVRFADNLDIAPDSRPPPTAPTIVERGPIVEPLSDVVEHSGSAKPAKAKSSRKPSRFKKVREETAQAVPKGPLDLPVRFLDQDRPTAPTGPDGRTLADKLVEREPAPIAMDVDGEFDDFADRHALADEHQRLRKKFIQRQGGFLKEDETPYEQLDEEQGGPPRQSRFKAARLSRQ